MSLFTTRVRTQIDEVIPERTTPTLRATLVDENNAPIAAPTALTLTLHKAGTIINSRDAVNILSSITAGVIEWTMTADDTQILDDAKSLEEHIALLEWTWGSGRAGKHEIVHMVANLKQVP